ncbi:MAG: D-aminoacyl-tRNA deacylase [Thermoleophilia bacterium]
MRAVVQRVTEAAVSVDDEEVGRIADGLLILVGVGHSDGREDADRLAAKIATLRIFEDADGKTNLSLADIGGAALVVSQFTLFADTRRGRRPSFTGAAEPVAAEGLVEVFRQSLTSAGIPTASGRFGAGMRVNLVNDGPFTLFLDTETLPGGSTS